MGAASDAHAVVDSATRVIGLEGLHIVDASIVPRITNGNLNAPTIMLAEKAADHILGRPLLSCAMPPFFRSPHWQQRQR